MANSYRQLSVEFYDADKPAADAGEVDYFASLTEKAEGPVLEAMCGSGRLLIPLLRRGYVIDGVDNSVEMLQSLVVRCREHAIPPPKVFLQSLESLRLDRSYGLIFIALGSFQLLPEAQVGEVLRRLRQSLLPTGSLVIDSFVPWDLLQREEPSVSISRKQPARDSMIHLTSEIRIEKAAQHYHLRNHYERRQENRVLASEDEALSVRWFFPEQFTQELAEAGFRSRYRAIPVSSPIPRRYLYEANPEAETPS